jgi:hypothetical protein
VSKLELDDLVNLQNEQSAVNTINNNSDLIEAAIEDTLSRSGTSPNEMNANLDMNSNRILNLPLPSADTEPVRKGEFDEWTGLAEDLEDAVAAAQLAQAAAEAAEANAEASESNAATSESNAAASELAAAQSESNAAASELAAAQSESNAAISESNASTSAGTATTQAGIATTQAGIATTQAGNASTSANNANNSAIAAAASAQDAADAFDEFDDIYLGSKTSDPTLDNDGDPLVAGQLYWNSVASNLRIYDGASWNVYSAATGLTSVVDDTNPALGGDLDLNSNDITGTGDINITGTIDATTINQGANNVLDDGDIGVTVQAYDSDLDAWAAVNPSSYLTTSAAAAAYQPLDSDLTSWAGVTRASGFDTFVATPNSSNLASLVTDETGSGALVFATSPTLVTPVLGTPTSGTLSNCDAASTSARGVVELATASEIRTGTDTTRVLGVAEAWSSGAIQTLTDASTIAVDFAAGINFSVTLGGNRTLGNPTNATKIGQSGFIVINQDASAPRTLSYDTNWEFPGGTAPVASTTNNAKDILFYVVQSSTSIIVTGYLKSVA